MRTSFALPMMIVLLLALLPVAGLASDEEAHQKCLQDLAGFFANSVHAEGITPTHSALLEANYVKKVAEVAKLQGTSPEAIRAKVRDILSGRLTEAKPEVPVDREASEARERGLLKSRVQPVAALQGYEFGSLWTSPNGPHVLVTKCDGPSVFFNTENGKITEVSLRNEDNLDLEFNGKRLLVTDHTDYVAIILDPESGEELLRVRDRRPTWLGPLVEFSQNGDVVAISKGKSVQVADSNSGQILNEIPLAYRPEVMKVTERRLAVLSRAHAVELISLNTKEVLNRIEFGRGNTVSLSPDLQRMLVDRGGKDPKTLLYNLRTGKVIKEIANSDGFRNFVKFSDNGSRFVLQHYDSQGLRSPIFRWFDSKTGALILENLPEHPRKSPSFDISPDGARLLVGPEPGHPQLLDISSNQPRSIVRMSGLGPFDWAMFSPDGSKLYLYSSEVEQIQVRSAISGKLHETIPVDAGAPIDEFATGLTSTGQIFFLIDGKVHYLAPKAR